MADTTNTAKAPKTSFVKGLKAEFKKIIWPNKETVAKQSAVIALLDYLIKSGLNVILFLGQG